MVTSQKHARSAPRVIALAGPNGAGKSTTAERLLLGPLAVDTFANADVIARGLSGFAPDSVAMAAGRVMKARLNALAEQRTSFAFETTLAGRSMVRWIKQLRTTGYEFHLVFLWLPSPEVAVARVAERVRLGGHDVPEPTLRRRYFAGISNFFELYQPLAESWKIVDNSSIDGLRMIAAGHHTEVDLVLEEATWRGILRQA